MTDAWLPILAVLGGTVLLVKGGDLLVRHAVELAVAYHVPKTVVGAVVLGFGTSLPELFVSLTAMYDGQSGIALGNVVGSNIANVGLILGCGAFLATLHVQRSVLRADLPLGVLATVVLMLWVGPLGEVSRVAGAALLGMFAGYLWLSLRQTKRFRVEEARADVTPRLGANLFGAAGGLAGIVVGAKILVWGAAAIAHWLDVPDHIIGLSVVAVGTSLPELAATLAAARRGEADLAVGNVAGSNLFNLLFVLGTTAVITPVPVADVFTERDFLVLAGFSVLAFPLLAGARRISRAQGLVLLVAYASYMAWTWGSGR